MSTKETQEKLQTLMEAWQHIEDASVQSTGAVIEKAANPLIRLVMEIIQRDSQMHHRVQGFIVDSLSKEAITLTPEDLADVWTLIEQHIELERKTVALAEQSLAALKGKKMVVQEYLLHYLLEDENKHNHILDQLETIKKGMYPYG